MDSDMETKILILWLAVAGLHSSLAMASPVEGELDNPASIYSKLSAETPLIVEVGLQYLHTDIPNIENIVLENTTVSDSMHSGTLDNSDYPDVLAQTLRAQLLLDEKTKWTASLKTYLPLNSLDQMDTGNIYQPEYVLYRTDAQRPRVLLMSGINLGDDWRVGLGGDIGFSVDTTAVVFLQSGNGEYSDQRIAAKLKPIIAPQASAQFKSYSLTVRAENKSELNINASGGANVFGGLAASKDFNYTTESALYYEPTTFELAGRTGLSENWALLWGISYELWSHFEAPAAVIQTISTNSCNGQANCSNSFSPSQAPSFQARDIVVPEAAVEWITGSDRWQLGYRYKESIFKTLPTSDNTNYLDPPRHDLLAQVTVPIVKTWQLTLNAQVSRLVSQTVVKSDSSLIGAPGYTASGWQYGGGMSIWIPLSYSVK
jgi:hypothetical protein